MSRYTPDYPEKGSKEAYEWARKMQRARKAKKIREAGLIREREHFGDEQMAKSKKEFKTRYTENLRRECAWCGAYLGDIAPRSDARVTHGICEECLRSQLSEVRKAKKNAPKKVRVKKNPIAVFNPPANVTGTIYNNAIEIRAQKTGGPLKGHYKHTFGDNVKILGLDNGDVLIHHAKGKRLWITRKEYEKRRGSHS